MNDIVVSSGKCPPAWTIINNRSLAEDGEVLKTARGARALQDLGEYYVLDLSSNGVLRKDVDLEEFGRNLGALKPFEKLV